MPESQQILVVHGPNLDLLGSREPEIYGRSTLEDINADLASIGKERDAEVEFFQSNHEGALIDRIHEATSFADGIVINPGGLTHTSVSLRDALAATAEGLVCQPLSVFHAYAFNTTRQLGANFEMLASHLAWLGESGAGDFAPAAEAAADLSREAKAFQFQLARAFHRRSAAGLAPRLDRPAETYARVFALLDRALGR